MWQRGYHAAASASAPNVHRRFYKPFILRIPGLLLICMIALALVGALDYAARTLPVVENRERVPDVSNLTSLLHKRQISGSRGTLSTSSSSGPTSSPVFGQALIARSAVSTSTSKLAPTETTIASAYVATNSISTTLFTTNPSAYIKSASTSTPVQVTGTTMPAAYITTNSKISMTVSSTNPGAYVATDITTKASGLSTTPAVGGIPTTSKASYLATVTIVLVSTVFNTDASGHVKSSLMSYTTTQTTSSTPQITTMIASTLSSAYLSTAHQTSKPTAGSTNSSQDGDPNLQTVLITWPLWWVFAAGYLPLLLAILVKVFWTSIYANVKLLEPFIQLSNPDGVLASDSLHTYYLSSSLIPDPILALFKRRWLIFWTSSVNLISSLLAPLASEVLFLDIHYDCGADTCWPPKLSADGIVLRLLQGLLCFIAIMALVIMIMLYRSTTGVYSDPSSIAAVASLLHHPEVLDEFRRFDDDISSKEMREQLGDKRYQMGMYQKQDKVWRYGIVPASQTYSRGWTQIALDPTLGSAKPETEKKKRTHYISKALDFGFFLFILGLLGVVVAYFMDGSDSGFNRFFNSNAFGPRFFMSSMGTIVTMYWKSIERKVQTITSFRRLIQSPAPANTSILFQRHSLPPLVLYASLIRGHFFAALVAFTTFLADILTITLAAVPFSPNEIYLELLICAYTSMGILGLMVLVLIGFLFWKRPLKEMPRKPDTLAGVMSYLCDSHFLADFEGCEGLSGGDLRKRIGRAGKRYEFGRYVGVDGKRRWMVEEEGFVL